MVGTTLAEIELRWQSVSQTPEPVTNESVSKQS